MASTVASKLNPSPRKKILVEKSEPIRSWVSMSEAKALFFSQELEYKPVAVGVSVHASMAPLDDPCIPPYDTIANYSSPRPQFRCYKPNPRIAALLRKQKEMGPLEDDDDSMFEDEEVSEDEEEESLSCNNSSCSPSLNDPSMPPYDPITNYLSPRPRFRCYKPNPRVAALLRKQKEMGPLEQDVDSMFEDEEVSEDEEEESLSCNNSSCSPSLNNPSMPPYDPITSYLSPRPRFRCYKPNPRIAALLRKQREMGPLEQDVDSMFEDEEVSEDEEEESLSCNNSSCSPSLNNPSMPPYDPITSYLSPRPRFRCYKPNPRIAALLRKQREMGPLEDEDDDNSMFDNFSEEVSEEEEGEESLDFDRKIEKKLWGVSRSMCFSMVVLLMLMVACVSVTKPPEFGLIEDLSLSDLQVVATTSSNAECIWSFVSKNTNGLGEGGIAPVPLNHSETQKVSWYDVVQGGELDSEMGIFEEEEQDGVDGVYDSDEDEQDDQVPEIDEIMHSDLSELDSSSMAVFESEQELRKGMVIISEDKFRLLEIGFSFFLGALSSTVAVFMYHYKRIPSLRVDNKMEYELGNNKQKDHLEEKVAFSSENWKTEVDDNASFTSAASSFLMRTPHTRKKRESLGSCSSEFTMGSPLYGSFTSLVKIPVKNVNGKEKITTTPVRRSIRIRSHLVTASS